MLSDSPVLSEKTMVVADENNASMVILVLNALAVFTACHHVVESIPGNKNREIERF